tara:strand:+ start:46 stop:315 length:270 start_codon:yes stop_codon:yes gene_type:complete
MSPKKIKTGDLVEIVYIGQSSSYFPWTDSPCPGIYLGEMEFTHHSAANNKEIDICHKVWALGKVRYIADLSEIKLLSTGSALSLTGSRN